MTTIKRASALTLLLLLSACAVPLPQSFDQHVAAVKTALTLTNNTATILVNGGHISKQQGRDVLEKTRPIHTVVDAATSEGDLTDPINAIKAAQHFLCDSVPDNPNCALLLQQGATL